jgi:hypothetical protein
MNRNLTLSLIFGIALSCAGLYLAFRRVPFADLAAGLTSMDYFRVLPAVLIVLCSFVVRNVDEITSPSRRIDLGQICSISNHKS